MVGVRHWWAPRRALGPALVAALAPLAAAVGCEAAGPTLARPLDPVVLTGQALPALLGTAPGDIVAFRWRDGGWQQLPVQVDERHDVDLGVVYHGSPNGVVVNAYADPATFSGPDADPLLDGDDEVTFMARDAGGAAPAGAGEPAGVVPGSGVAVSAIDSDPTGTAVAYLFRRSSPALDPGAGAHYVDYAFTLASGDYRTTYRTTAGPNPEDSSVTTAAYTRHFADRWLEDGLRITTPGASRAPFLERHKVQFVPQVCVRSEDTFDAGEGAFVANRTGPVRAIRSYVGANSGPNTMRTHVFYEAREDVVTDLRVHDIPGVMDFDDFTAAAVGMTYRDNANPDGVTVDGRADTLAPARPLTWQAIDGAPGTLVTATRVEGTASVPLEAWYEDETNAPTVQCGGDNVAYGAHGAFLDGTIPCTDPQFGCTATLRSTRVHLYLAPGQSAEADATAARHAVTPLVTAIAPWPPGRG